MIGNLARNMALAAVTLAGFAVVGTGLVVMTHTHTQDLIEQAQRAALEASLNQLVPADRYDNRITEDRIDVIAPEGLGATQPVTIYRARKQGQPVALFATPVAPDGYSGPIRLLIGLYADGTLAGVRILEHKETPGLGDGIEAQRSRWVLGFTGKSLMNPAPADWKVKKEGGAFDQFTGATITPRAVVKAVRNFLDYARAHRDPLFAPTPSRPAAS
jgi:Na+-translocating ferredoxin:NAD+ oxidoreductase subunit G